MNANPPAESGQRAGRREWIGLAVLALPAMLISLDFSVLNLAVPALSSDLKPDSSQLLWAVDIYGFLLAGFLVTMGTLGDRIGRRRLLMLGAASFGIASVISAYSSSVEMLIAGRALLGVAGATLLPSTLSLLGNMFKDPQQRTVAIAVWSTSLPLGGAIGPLVGGALLEWFWWGAAFLLGVPVMAILLVAGPILLPEFRDTKAGRPDLISVALSLLTILPVIYGLKEIAKDGVGTASVLAIVVGVLFGAAFVVRQRRLADPLIDVRLFRKASFSAALATNLLSYFVILGILLLFAQYLQLVVGLSPLVAGLWTLPAMGGLILGAMVTPAIVKRLSPAITMTCGLVVATIGFAIVSQVSATSSLAVAVTGVVLLSVGLAPVVTLVVNLVLGSAPPEKAGAATGLSQTSTEFGGALGIAILGSVATVVYRGQVADGIPAGVPADVAETARDTIGGAVGVTGELPAQVGSALLGTARDAFSNGMSLAAGISAGVMAVLAVTTFVLLRKVQVQPAGHGEAAEPAEPAETPADEAEAA